MQAPLPAAPQPQGQWQQLKYNKLATTSEYLDLTWDEFDNQYDEYRVHLKLATVDEAAYKQVFAGVRLRLKNLTTDAVAWHSGSYYHQLMDDNPTSSWISGFSTGGYAKVGFVGRGQYGVPWSGFSMVDIWLPGHGQNSPACEVRANVIKNIPFVNYEPSSTRGGFGAYPGTHTSTTLYRVTGLRTKLSQYTNLNDNKYHATGCTSIVYGLRLP